MTDKNFGSECSTLFALPRHLLSIRILLFERLRFYPSYRMLRKYLQTANNTYFKDFFQIFLPLSLANIRGESVRGEYLINNDLYISKR